MGDIQLFNDHFQNFKQYGIPKAQLISLTSHTISGKMPMDRIPSGMLVET